MIMLIDCCCSYHPPISVPNSSDFCYCGCRLQWRRKIFQCAYYLLIERRWTSSVFPFIYSFFLQLRQHFVFVCVNVVVVTVTLFYCCYSAFSPVIFVFSC
jgi:hypothetical protein